MTFSEDAACAAVVQYHDASKHYFDRLAPGPRGLDWSTQPSPFRRFEGAPVLELPRATGGSVETSVSYDALCSPSAAPGSPIDLGHLGSFLRYGLGLAAWKRTPWERWSLRVNPPSGNLHPTEAYIVSGPIGGTAEPAGTFHYAPDEHVLERRCSIPLERWREAATGWPSPCFLVALTSVHWREAWKYGERAFRYCQHDVGHALAALRVSAAMQGWLLRVLPAWSDADIETLLGLDREADFARAEREAPACVALVTPGGLPSPPLRVEDQTPVIDALHGATWTGRASRLSTSHVPWAGIDQVGSASRKGASPVPTDAALPQGHPPHEPAMRACDARQLVRARRSAVAFRPDASMPLTDFLGILARVLPYARVPWDLTWWTPAIDLVLFVHRVQGIAPGLYFFGRRDASVSDAREAFTRDFEWERPAGVNEAFPLWRLATGDAREAASMVSCFQDIAADSCFSLGMLAEFEPNLRRFGAWFYRALFWEAGLIGHVLYLEAEAAGFRGTGIGCFSDDGVHELVGLEGHRFQSLYHFTIGAPIDDKRLATEPPYPWET